MSIATAQVHAIIDSLTPKGHATMLAVGQRKLSFFNEGIVEGGGIWGSCLTGELGHKSSGVINRLAALGLWEVSPEDGDDGSWWSLTELGAAVANALAAPADAPTDALTVAWVNDAPPVHCTTHVGEHPLTEACDEITHVGADALPVHPDQGAAVSRRTHFRMDYPIPAGRPVLQGHADACAEYGHGTWTEDGTDKGVCPRCGEVTTPAPVEAPVVKWTRVRPGEYTSNTGWTVSRTSATAPGGKGGRREVAVTAYPTVAADASLPGYALCANITEAKAYAVAQGDAAAILSAAHSTEERDVSNGTGVMDVASHPAYVDGHVTFRGALKGARRHADGRVTYMIKDSLEDRTATKGVAGTFVSDAKASADSPALDAETANTIMAKGYGRKPRAAAKRQGMRTEAPSPALTPAHARPVVKRHPSARPAPVHVADAQVSAAVANFEAMARNLPEGSKGRAYWLRTAHNLKRTGYVA